MIVCFSAFTGFRRRCSFRGTARGDSAGTCRWLRTGRRLVLVQRLALAVVLAVPLVAWSEQRGLVFGFLPILSTERLVLRFSPLTDYLSAELGVPVHLETAPDFRTFIARTGEQQRYDLLFTAPHLYYLASHDYGYRALVRVDRESMRAVIVVPRDSAIRDLSMLRGKRLATVDHLALATVLVRQRLAVAGINADTNLSLVETPSHNAALLSTLRGHSDASGLILPVYLRAGRSALEATRILATTDTSPHMPISAAPWLDEDLAAQVKAVLLAMPQSPQGRRVLQVAGWPGFTATDADDYASMEWAARQISGRPE